MLLFAFCFPFSLKLFQHLGKTRNDGADAKPLPVVIGRRATDDFTAFDIASNAGLGRYDDAVSYMAVPSHSDLSGEDGIVADVRGTGKADLRAEERVLADRRAMAYLHEVVDLRAATDSRFADARAVNAGVRLDFDVIFDNCRAGLDNFMPFSAVILGEAVAVRAYHDAILKDYVVSQPAILANDGVGMGEEVISNADIRIDDDMGQDGGVFADGTVFADHDVGADGRAVTDPGRGMDDGCWMNSGRVCRGRVKDCNGAGKGQIGIFNAQRRGFDFGEVRCDEDGSSARFFCEARVLGIGYKRDNSRARFFNTGDACNIGIRCTPAFRTQELSEFR
jgi:hypothetical protein